MFRTLLFGLLIIILPSMCYGIDTQTYSDRDGTYTAYKSQISTLYRNMIDGEGESYNVQDTYTDYYGDTKTVVTSVTTEILVNNPSYYNSDLHKKIDRIIDIDRYSLREFNVKYADRANTADKSEEANLTRVSDFGGYYPKDCTMDPACKTVKWIEKNPYALYANTANEADTVICPTGSIENIDTKFIGPFGGILPGTTPKSDIPLPDDPFEWILAERFPDAIICYYHAGASRIYHAKKTDGPVEKSLYLVSSGNYNNVRNYQFATSAQIAETANVTHWLTTYNDVTGQQLNAVVEFAPNALNAATITNSYLNYVKGNRENISVNIP
jgi:hypothetical protein